jgi:hypothetical protein
MTDTADNWVGWAPIVLTPTQIRALEAVMADGGYECAPASTTAEVKHLHAEGLLVRSLVREIDPGCDLYFPDHRAVLWLKSCRPVTPADQAYWDAADREADENAWPDDRSDAHQRAERLRARFKWSSSEP